MSEEKDNEIDYKTLTLYILQLNIQKAQDLKNADIIGKSDPFAVITVNSQKYVTKTIEDDLNPVWNEHTTFSFIEPLDKPITIEVWDYDKGEIGKHDSLGSASLSVMDVFKPDSKGFDDWVKLENVKSGKVFLSIRGKLIKPYDLESRIKTMTEVANHQQKELDTQKEKIQNLEEEKNNLQGISDELSGNIQTLKEGNENLQKQVDQGEQDLEEKKRAKAITESEIRLTGEKITEYTDDIMPDLAEKTMIRKNDLKEAKRKGEDLRKDIADIKENMIDTDRKCEKVKDDIKNVQSGVQSYVWNEESRSNNSKSPSNEDDMRQPLLQSN